MIRNGQWKTTLHLLFMVNVYLCLSVAASVLCFLVTNQLFWYRFVGIYWVVVIGFIMLAHCYMSNKIIMVIFVLLHFKKCVKSIMRHGRNRRRSCFCQTPLLLKNSLQLLMVGYTISGEILVLVTIFAGRFCAVFRYNLFE